MTTRPARQITCLALVGAVGLLAGCSGGDAGSSPSPEPAENSRYFATYLDEATTYGADQQQIDVLADAVSTGVLTFESVMELTRKTFACFTEHGIEYTENDPHELGIGYFMPSYSFSAQAPGLTLDETTEAADECINGYSYWASIALQDSRVIGEARDARMRRDLPTILECLRDNGVSLPDEATLDEIRTAVGSLAMEGAASCYDDWQT